MNALELKGKNIDEASAAEETALLSGCNFTAAVVDGVTVAVSG